TVGNERADALAKLAASKDQLDTVRQKLKLGIGARYYSLRNGKKDGIIQQRDHGLRNFSKRLNSIGYTMISTITKCRQVTECLVRINRDYSAKKEAVHGELLKTIEHILLKCKIWGKEREDWPKSWLQKDISDLVFYSPLKKGYQHP
ncbi:hypothetical protein AVEN_96069-2-1, partial [Araneus ventricosus]